MSENGDDPDERLQSVRERIDAIDRRILALLNERAGCAQEVAEIKRAAGESNNFSRPEREARLLRELAAATEGPLEGAAVTRVFREIVSACRALEQPLAVAFLGPAGTFTQAAVYRHFGRSIESRPLGAIDEVFREVAAGAAQFGVVPVENSTEGMVTHTLDVFVNSNLRICGEVLLRVHHQLVAAGTDPSAVKTLYSHQQSFAQCREWLDANLAHAERIAVSSNAEAARRAAAEPDAAAIAPAMAAEIYELNTLAERIEDEPDNTTRFLVIGDYDVPPTGDDKTSLLLSARNRPGALFHLIRPLAEHGIDMTRLESRPTRGRLWEYVFFVDIRGHAEDEVVKPALEALKQEAALCRVLGSYPRALS
ncbi:MAG: prephenate dehydratase [Halofilum sp. (in: g-proteobacteria)]|nr:prephenate dehydratase [Halofilum sp. (in: g-proteobacteria)]